jgi:hypothetical protein
MSGGCGALGVGLTTGGLAGPPFFLEMVGMWGMVAACVRSHYGRRSMAAGMLSRSVFF